MGPARVSAVLAVLAALLAGAFGTPPATARAAVVPCSSGLVALTFDDGPSAAHTPGFLDELQRQQVPATFFLVGDRVSANPAITRRQSALGFALGNHGFSHERFVRLGDAAIRSSLRRTRQAIREAGVAPSTLMRPPYGGIDDRVRRVVGDLGLVPVLWTADPRDWANRTTAAITASTLAQLHPRQANIVLLHDGVKNSGRTLRALPRIIRLARGSGYCFARLDAAGRPTPPVPVARISDASAQERPGGSAMTATVTLDRPTSRATSVRVRTVAESATSGRDYVTVDRRVRFAVGATRATVRVRVRDDLRDEPTERLTFRLSQPVGLRVRDATGVGEVRDDDPPPRLAVADAQVTEPGTGTVEVPVTLRLSRASEKAVGVTVSTRAGTADADDFVPKAQRIDFAPGQVTVRFAVTVVADAAVEGPETFTVEASRGTNVDVTGVAGVVTILLPSG